MGLEPCRLCGAAAEPVFQGVILDHYKVAYFRCRGCGSLQTEPPYWLEDAYREGGLALSDTHAAYRAYQSLAMTLLAARIFRVKGRVLDFGGGDGLLCRLLRDHGMDAYLADEFAQASYAKGFRATLADGPYELVTAFEVLEHLPDPRSTLTKLFGMGAKVVLTSTIPYKGQGVDWSYLSPETGQHIFFYSTEGIEWIEKTFGYEATVIESFILFSRPRTIAQRVALKLVRSTTLRFARAAISFCASTKSAAFDQANILKKLRSQRPASDPLPQAPPEGHHASVAD